MRRGATFFLVSASGDSWVRDQYFSAPGTPGHHKETAQSADLPATTSPDAPAPVTVGTCHQEQVFLPSRRLGKSNAFSHLIAAAKAAGLAMRLTPGAAYFFAPPVAQKTLNASEGRG